MEPVSIRQHEARALGIEEVAQGLYLLRLAAPELARESRAGQFVMVRCGGPGLQNGTENPLFLRRPMALHRILPAEGEVALLFQVVGRGTAALAATRTGQSLDLLGPLGQPVELGPEVRRVAFVAGGVGIASLTALLDEGTARGWEMALLTGARTAWRLYPSRLLPSGVQEMAATDDGSAGVRAPVTHLVPQVQDRVDVVVACGPTPMLRALGRMRRDGLLQRRTLLLLESRMGCGFGACMGCAVATRQGVRLVCCDGPVFDLDDILWEDPLAPTL